MRNTLTVNSFNTGELSSFMSARVDYEKYSSGCLCLENFLVLPWGGIKRRTGSEFIAQAKFNSGEINLIAFSFNTEQSYIIECGEGYMRFYMNSSVVLEDDAVTPYEITSPYISELHSIRYVQSGDVLFLVHPEYHPRKLTRKDHNEWVLESIDYEYPACSVWNKNTDLTVTPSGTTGTVTVTAAEDIFSNEMAGDGFLVMKHPVEENSLTKQFTANGTSASLPVSRAWVIETTGVWEGTLLLERSLDNGTTWQFYRSWTSNQTRNIDEEGYEELTNALYRVRMTNYHEDSDPENNYYCSVTLSCTDYWMQGIVKITAVNSATQITGTVTRNIGSTEKTADWVISAWNGYNGYPSSVCFYAGRLIYAATKRQPQTLWLSKVDDFEDFETGTKADESMTYTIAEDGVNRIQWIMPGKGIVIGTEASVGIFKASNSQEPLSAENKEYTTELHVGASGVNAVRIDDILLFMQRYGEALRELAYNFENDGYNAPIMNILSEHILRGGVKQICYEQHPNPILWLLRNDGVLVGFTYNRLQGITAWHRHITDGKILSVAVISESEDDELWLTVEREIGGVTKRFIEKIYKPYDVETVGEGFFLDCALKGEFEEETSALAGLDHLEGGNITVVGDGAVYENLTVANGTVTLPYPAKTVTAGINYISKVTLMPLEIIGQINSIGRVKRVSQAALKFINSLGGRIYVNGRPQSIGNTNRELVSGYVKVTVPGGFGEEQILTVIQDKPYPMNLILVSLNMEVLG